MVELTNTAQGSRGGLGSSMSEIEVVRWIRRQLGHGIIDVELTDEHFSDIIYETKQWFAHRVGVKKFMTVSTLPGQTKYFLPSSVVTVLDVWLPATPIALGAYNSEEANIAYGYLLGAVHNNTNAQQQTRISPYPYSQLLLNLQYLDTIGRIIGAPDFEYWQHDRLLILTPTRGLTSSTAQILLRVTVSDFETTDIDSPQEMQWFRRWALAEAKIVLGTIRSKFDSIPSVGGDATMDGGLMQDNGDKEKEIIEEEVLTRIRVTPFHFG